MAKKNIVMSSNVTLQGEKEIYCMATKMQLDKYVVFVCGESIKSKEADIKENIKKILAAEYKDKKFVFQVNKYLPNDAAMMITKDMDKYYVLTSMGQINKNEYYEELIIEKSTNHVEYCKFEKKSPDSMKDLTQAGSQHILETVNIKPQKSKPVKKNEKINNNRKTTKR